MAFLALSNWQLRITCTYKQLELAYNPKTVTEH